MRCLFLVVVLLSIGTAAPVWAVVSSSGSYNEATQAIRDLKQVARAQGITCAERTRNTLEEGYFCWRNTKNRNAVAQLQNDVEEVRLKLNSALDEVPTFPDRERILREKAQFELQFDLHCSAVSTYEKLIADRDYGPANDRLAADATDHFDAIAYCGRRDTNRAFQLLTAAYPSALTRYTDLGMRGPGYRDSKRRMVGSWLRLIGAYAAGSDRMNAHPLIAKAIWSKWTELRDTWMHLIRLAAGPIEELPQSEPDSEGSLRGQYGYLIRA